MCKSKGMSLKDLESKCNYMVYLHPDLKDEIEIVIGDTVDNIQKGESVIEEIRIANDELNMLRINNRSSNV